jgi:hypothetical protein
LSFPLVNPFVCFMGVGSVLLALFSSHISRKYAPTSVYLKVHRDKSSFFHKLTGAAQGCACIKADATLSVRRSCLFPSVKGLVSACSGHSTKVRWPTLQLQASIPMSRPNMCGTVLSSIEGLYFRLEREEMAKTATPGSTSPILRHGDSGIAKSGTKLVMAISQRSASQKTRNKKRSKVRATPQKISNNLQSGTPLVTDSRPLRVVNLHAPMNHIILTLKPD